MRSWPVPQTHIRRDACLCHAVVVQERRAWPTLKLVCSACQAWENGYVLVEGQRRYLRGMWIMANIAAAME